MPEKSERYKLVLRQYEQIRTKKEHELKKRKNDIYTACPRLEEIEREISLTGVRIGRMVLQKPEDSQLLLLKLQQSISELKQEKKLLLNKMGFSEKALQIEYVCKDCKDTGYINHMLCNCMKQKLIDLAYDQSNIREIVKCENFDTFDIRYYSEVHNEEEGISPLENIKRIFNTCMDFCQYFDSTFQNLLLYGETGLGKTFLCNCIAKELLDKGNTVLYIPAGQLFRMIEKQRFRKEDDEAQQDTMEDLLSVDLLIIDDLGTEFGTILSSAELFHIINNRMLTKKSVIVSTNLSPDNLIHQYSDRVVSRIVGTYTTLKFFGDDIRVKKKFNKK